MDLAIIYIALGIAFLALLTLVATIRIPHLDVRRRGPAAKVLATGILLILVVACWPVATTSHATSPASLLDRVMPRYQLREVHAIRIHAPPHAIEWGLRWTDATDVRGFVTLMRARSTLDDARIILHGPVVSDYQSTWTMNERNSNESFYVGPPMMNYTPEEGSESVTHFVRAPNDVPLELPPPYITREVQPPDTTETGGMAMLPGRGGASVPLPDSVRVRARRILDAHTDVFVHAGADSIARNDTIATFRYGTRNGREAWLEVRVEPGGDSYHIIRHMCDGAQPDRDWTILNWLQLFGYRRMGYEAGREFVLGQIQPVAPRDPHWRRPVAADVSAFAAFHEPGCEKVAMSFAIRPLGNGEYRLVVERRALAVDGRTAHRYAASWRLSRPFRDAFLADWLGAVKNRAEAWNPNCGRTGLSGAALPDTLNTAARH